MTAKRKDELVYLNGEFIPYTEAENRGFKFADEIWEVPPSGSRPTSTAGHLAGARVCEAVASPYYRIPIPTAGAV